MDDNDLTVSSGAVDYKRSGETSEAQSKVRGPEPEKKYNYDDYMTWNDGKRWELIDGVPYAMGAPTTQHQAVIRELFLQLGNYLSGKTCKVFAAPYDVRLKPNDKDDVVVQPDLVIICDRSKIEKAGCVGAPDMVIEILSPSSIKHDYLRKFQVYEKSGIREYWIVNPEDETLIVAILENKQYVLAEYTETDIVPVGIFDDCVIDMSKVFVEI